MGVGKSTLTNILAEDFGFFPVVENLRENLFLPKFYKDMKRWAFHSQIFFLVEKANQLKKLKRLKKTIIQDVSIYQDVFSYAKAHYILGNMEAEEWKLYVKIFRALEKDLKKPDLIIFLNAPVETIFGRIVKRDRSYEVGTGKKKLMDYLTLLQKLNESWIKKIGRKIKIKTIETDNFDYLHERKKRRELIKIIKKIL